MEVEAVSSPFAVFETLGLVVAGIWGAGSPMIGLHLQAATLIAIGVAL